MTLDTNSLKEQLQENLLCYLDGLSNETLDRVCQIVIDTIKEAERQAQ